MTALFNPGDLACIVACDGPSDCPEGYYVCSPRDYEERDGNTCWIELGRFKKEPVIVVQDEVQPYIGFDSGILCLLKGHLVFAEYTFFRLERIS